MILKCVARCRCSGKVAQEKVDCLYTRLSSHEDAERLRRRFRVSLRHQINTQSNSENRVKTSVNGF